MKRSRKIKKPDSTTSNLILEEIIGLTTKNANGLASSVSNSKCAYIAGCVMVFFDVESCSAKSHLMVSHRMPKPLSCVAVSHDATFVAAGESGHLPAVLLWKGATQVFLGELKGHQFGVACMAFSPDGRRLASVGYPQDGFICLWDLRTKMLLTKVKACSTFSAISSVSFSLDAKVIVTAGRKHLKLWTVELSKGSRTNTKATSVVIHGKPLNLGHQKGHSFIAITSPDWTDKRLEDHNLASNSSLIYALADTGILCLLNSGLAMIKSVDLKVKKGLALSTSNGLVACACNNGIVKLYTINSLKYAGSLHFSNAKRCKKATTSSSQASINQSEIQHFTTLPDAIACQFSTSEKLVVIYDDHSLYIWNFHDVNKATRCCVLVSHSACIWDIKNLPCGNMHDPSLACVSKGCPGGVSFVTCSDDGSIRLWDLALQPIFPEDCISLATYNSSTIRELDATKHLVSAGVFERDSVASGTLSPGFRSMAVSSDGKYLAAGDYLGNIHIFNLCTFSYMCIQDAHDAEILSLSFSLTRKQNNVSDSYYFLASGGQDRMIHIYDVKRNFDLMGSVEDHSDAVTCIKISLNGDKILSCSAVMSLVFHEVVMTDMGCKISEAHQVASLGTISDIDFHPSADVFVVVGEDKKINAFEISSWKLVRSIRHDEDLGNPIKVTMDPSCSYLVCSYSNGAICLYDYVTGEMVAEAAGHDGIITGVIFLPDCKHLASVSSDGCIFLWKLPSVLSTRMLQRLQENSCPLALQSITWPVTSCHFKVDQADNHECEFSLENLLAKGNLKQVKQRLLCQDRCSQETSAFQFSISRLPKWAQAKVVTPGSPTVDPTSASGKQGGWQNFSSSVNCFVDKTSVCPRSQSPSKFDSKGCKQFSSNMSRKSTDIDSSKGSPTTNRNYGGFALDSRWSTIHTVCFDLPDSPDGLEMKDQSIPLFAFSNLSRDQSMETSMTIKHSKLSNSNLTQHAEKEKVSLAKHTISDNSGTSCYGIDQCWVGKSSLQNEEVVSQMSAKLCAAATQREDVENATLDVLSPSGNDLLDVVFAADNSLKKEVVKEALFSQEQEERVNECKKALSDLDAAADHALKLFSQIPSLRSREEISGGSEIQLYSEATKALFPLAKKIQAIAKMVQPVHDVVSEKR